MNVDNILPIIEHVFIKISCMLLTLMLSFTGGSKVLTLFRLLD